MLDINHIDIINFINDISRFILPHAEAAGDAELNGSVDLVSALKFTAVFVAGLAAIFGFGLAYAAQKFSVVMDPKIDEVKNVLAGAHCGACGFAGCQQYAEAVVQRAEVPTNLCAPAGAHGAEMVAMITGKKAVITEPQFARIMCQGGSSRTVKRFVYNGIIDCRAAVIAGGGDKSCIYGCLGYGTCAHVCPFGAMSMNSDNIPVVDVSKCTACKKCVEACPKKVIEITPGSKTVMTACHSKDKGAATRKNCQIGCIACGMCEKVCPFEAASVKDNCSKIDPAKCKVCGLCVRKCPTKAIVDLLPIRTKAVISAEKCIGCDMCTKVCPMEAASGEMKKTHVINQDKCIGCGICTARCPKQAISGTFNTVEVHEAARIKSEVKKAA
ncbi:MAG: RnfABCDGE type electron transport complex subunit B [Nitrospirae bacterium]|nr:RnfABCDGE type electron transport complex subunit B [Nitrospirota bacterium]MBF0542505.1 RnfABCDGE type electron transport complex subunit B [Nitrospirota bacterium]